jgi:hypothetical protein
MSSSADMNAARYNLLLTVSLIIYIFAYCARSHFVMNIVSVKFLLLFFCIKLLVKMTNILTLSAQLFTLCLYLCQESTLCKALFLQPSWPLCLLWSSVFTKSAIPFP